MRSKQIFGFQFHKDHELIRTKIIDKHMLEQQSRHAAAGNTDLLRFEWVNQLYGTDNCQQFYLRNSFLNAAQLVQIKPDLDLAWLTPAMNGLFQFNFGNSFIRFHKQDANITLLAAHYALKPDQTHQVVMMPVRIQLDELTTGAVTYPDELALQTCTDLLLQLLVFQCLGPVIATHLNPGERYLSKKTTDGLYNDEKYPITVLATGILTYTTQEGGISWVLHHYAQPGALYNRVLEKRPKTAAQTATR